MYFEWLLQKNYVMIACISFLHLLLVTNLLRNLSY